MLLSAIDSSERAAGAVIVVVVMIWVGLAFAGYMAGASRGRGPAGLALGLLLGPLGLAIALFLPPLESYDRGRGRSRYRDDYDDDDARYLPRARPSGHRAQRSEPGEAPVRRRRRSR